MTLLVIVGLPAQQHGTRFGYGWPVKPFDRPHPVRGNFGDPRTIFDGRRTRFTLLHGSGRFERHTGIDVAAADGTRVYAVVSGIAHVVSSVKVIVETGARRFEYWHIEPSVADGEAVTAEESVLGRVLPGWGHVHLSELDRGRFVNPLARGHLAPYVDATVPRVTLIGFRDARTGAPVSPLLVHGRLEIVAEAYDLPAMRVPGEWAGLPVTPALVTWRIERRNGRVVAPERVAVDFRTRFAPKTTFWDVYARGTYQNIGIFGRHRAGRQPGRYVFKLASSWDMRKLADGVYDVCVTAADVRGNHGSLKLRFTVANAR